MIGEGTVHAGLALCSLPVLDLKGHDSTPSETGRESNGYDTSCDTNSFANRVSYGRSSILSSRVCLE
jgi:hypothetical protein